MNTNINGYYLSRIQELKLFIFLNSCTSSIRPRDFRTAAPQDCWKKTNTRETFAVYSRGMLCPDSSWRFWHFKTEIFFAPHKFQLISSNTVFTWPRKSSQNLSTQIKSLKRLHQKDQGSILFNLSSLIFEASKLEEEKNRMFFIYFSRMPVKNRISLETLFFSFRNRLLWWEN